MYAPVDYRCAYMSVRRSRMDTEMTDNTGSKAHHSEMHVHPVTSLAILMPYRIVSFQLNCRCFIKKAWKICKTTIFCLILTIVGIKVCTSVLFLGDVLMENTTFHPQIPFIRPFFILQLSVEMFCKSVRRYS